MSAQTVIDSLEFARAEGDLQGRVPVSDLTRLHDSLFDTDGTISFRLKGGHDEENHPIVIVEVGTLLHLRCQRCLRSLPFELKSCNRLRLIPPDDHAGSTIIDPALLDCIEASEALEVVALIEDEVLLSLPMSPRHEGGGCAIHISEADRAVERPNPFAGLAELKKVVDNRN